MKLKECCITKCINCKDCNLYKILMRNSVSKNSIKLQANCLYAVKLLIQYLHDELQLAPSGKKDLEATNLIEIVVVNIPEECDLLLLDLCEMAMNSIISRGLKTQKEVSRAFLLLGYYNTIFKIYEKNETNDALCLERYAGYLNVRFQVLHLIKQYGHVIKEFEDVKGIFSQESPVQRELVAHFTSSSYLTKNKKHKITSRDVAEQLFEIVKERYDKEQKIAENDYYCLAKFLEHYIEEENIQKGLDIIKPFMEIIDEDEIESGKEALHKAIFHRDMFEALGKIESDESEFHYDKAQEIIHEFGIMDQQMKLLEKRKEVEQYILKGYYPTQNANSGIYVKDSIIINSSLQNEKKTKIQVQRNERTFTEEEISKIIQKMIDLQEDKYEQILHFMADEMLRTRGDIQEIGRTLKESKESNDTILKRLKDIINDGMETGGNLYKIAAFLNSIMFKVVEKFPEFEEIIQSLLVNS